MDSEHRERLRLRYLSLGWGEWLAGSVFVFVAAFSLDDAVAALGARAAVWWALAPLLFVLLQAGAYWLAARTWVGIGSMPRVVARTYLVLKGLNAVVLVVALVGMVTAWPDTIAGAVLGMAVWLFAVAEYVNYFVMRLAYRVDRWWRGVRSHRTPQLMLDVREGAG